MRLRVNGENQEFEAGMTVTGLLESLGLTAAAVLVEVNHEVLDRGGWDRHELADGDIVEILQVVAGG